MDSKRIFQDFNHSKFVVFSCLFPAGLFISLYLDDIVKWSLWIVFIPLWILELFVILGAIFGSIAWCRRPYRRNDADSFTDFKAMLITVGIQVLLLLFELLLCNKLENNSNSPWIFVFMPLYLVSPLAIGACIWGYKNARSLELEGLISLNILLIIFVSLKLDGLIKWGWSVIFIPLWIIMTLPTVVVLHHIWTLIFLRSNFHGVERQTLVTDTIIWILVDIPLLTFQILLSYKLDSSSNIPWVQIFIPLHICLLALIWGSFGRKGGNPWWFGLREDFCTFFLRTCPCMRLYGNVEYKEKGESEDNSEDLLPQDSKLIPLGSVRYTVEVPVTHIESPD